MPVSYPANGMFSESSNFCKNYTFIYSSNYCFCLRVYIVMNILCNSWKKHIMETGNHIHLSVSKTRSLNIMNTEKWVLVLFVFCHHYHSLLFFFRLFFTGDSPDRGSDCSESLQPSKVNCLKTYFISSEMQRGSIRGSLFKCLKTSESMYSMQLHFTYN